MRLSEERQFLTYHRVLNRTGSLLLGLAVLTGTCAARKRGASVTCLAPSECFCGKKARAHKKLTDWVRQIMMPLRR